MRTISKSSKKGQYYSRSYAKSQTFSVNTAYKSPSSKKIQAETLCMLEMAKERGRNYKVISSGCFNFTAAWETDKGLRIETRDNSYIIPND